MKKNILFLLLLLLNCFLAIGCGKVKNNQENSMAISGKPENTDTPLPTEAVAETPQPKSGTFSPKQKYSDSSREVSILGLKEYKKIKTDRYTDKAQKGKTYLTLFLEVRNTSPEKDYFHPDYLSAEIDGKNTENTFLLNEPEGYPTIFTNIESGSAAEGFIVWEVPENWKKLNVTYTGWCGNDGLTLYSTLTRKDLKKPEKFE